MCFTEDIRLALIYGFHRVGFISAVPVGAFAHARECGRSSGLEQGVRARIIETFEREGEQKRREMAIETLTTMTLERPVDGVLVATLDRPDRLNAMTNEMF